MPRKQEVRAGREASPGGVIMMSFTRLCLGATFDAMQPRILLWRDTFHTRDAPSHHRV